MLETNSRIKTRGAVQASWYFSIPSCNRKPKFGILHPITKTRCHLCLCRNHPFMAWLKSWFTLALHYDWQASQAKFQVLYPNPANGRQKLPFPGWKLLRVHASLPPVLCKTCVNYTWISHVTTGYILSSELGARESQATKEGKKNGKALILITGAVN